MTPEQDPKYSADDTGRIYNRASGQVIPDDEPIFIFRARDRHAVEALEWYAMQCQFPSHVKVIEQRITDFKAFAARNPARMKEPDSP